MAFYEGSGNRDGLRGSISMGNLAQLERRTVESSRIIRDNLNSVFEELRPLVQPRLETPQNTSRLSLSNWLQTRTQSSVSAPSINISRNDMDSFVINLESDERESGGSNGSGAGRLNEAPSVERQSSSHSIHSAPSSTTTGMSEPEANNNMANEEGVMDILNLNPEAYSFTSALKAYLPFVFNVLAKLIYDYSPAILLFIGLYGTFAFYNIRLKAEIAHPQRNVPFLMFATVHLILTICFFYYLYDDLKLYLSLVFIPPYVQPLTVTDLLWLVAVTDFILKLITIIIKILVTIIPHSLFEAKRRGKWYLAIETSSQLYRSLVPIQPWLYYLLESYHGPQKVVGVFLSAAYMVSKGADLMKRVRAWWASMLKLLQNVQLGVSPDKEQLTSAGVTCPICRDDYDKPVLLLCSHVFCESCVARWFDHEQTCPLCRAKVVDDPSWRDGSSTYFVQLF